jgi:hypothetical protein
VQTYENGDDENGGDEKGRTLKLKRPKTSGALGFVALNCLGG